MEHSPSYGLPEVIIAEEPIYVGRSEILEKYHWSKTMMRRYLGAPDLVEERRSNVYGTYTVHLFLRARILNAPSTPGPIG
jgi:hypothetical protein